jgi:hypothetical protein
MYEYMIDLKLCELRRNESKGRTLSEWSPNRHDTQAGPTEPD